MGWKMIIPIAAALACGATTAMTAEEKPANAASVIAAKDLTREHFQTLPPDAVIEINGEHITKSEFQARNTKALEEAAKKLHDARAPAQAALEARRKVLLDRRAGALAEANKKVEAEIAKLVTADAAAHGPNWQARKKQAADLFDKAAKATPLERSALLKQAADLLAPAGK
jgi:aspartyl/asparaginyl beta-hydroxylase (cupin superfamily)